VPGPGRTTVGSGSTTAAKGWFTQIDPIGLAGGLNLYGFAGGDPVNFSDPFGLCPPEDNNVQDCATVQFWRQRAANSSSLLGHLGNSLMAGLAAMGEAAAAEASGQPVDGCGEQFTCGVVPSVGRGGPAAGRTASGRPIDRYGNVLGPSGKPMVHTVRHSTKKRARDAARRDGDGAPENHASPTNGNQHFHATKQWEKVPNSIHHEYPEE
jgi:uncharacterized protein RhaS with RHS repeats